MKNLITLIVCLMLSSVTFGQEYKLAHNTGMIVLTDVDEVTITGYDGNEIIFSGMNKDREEDSRAEGLKLFNSLGLDDNTELGINVIKDGENVKVTSVGRHDGEEITIKLPRNMGISYSHNGHNGDDIKIENVAGEINISASYNDIHLADVTGPMAIKSVYGSIEANFSTLSQTGSISLNSVYDLIDVSFPSGSAYDVNIRTPYGNIYSDVDIKAEADSDGMKNISSKKLAGKVNGGGVEVTLKSGYENVYLRKK